MPVLMAESQRRRRKPLALFMAYAGVLALIAFWPTPVDAGADGFITRVLNALHRWGIPQWFDYNAVEAGSNVALFIPFGLLLASILPMNCKWLAAPAGAFASVLIEIAQSLFRPERYPSIQDVLANSLGAAWGAVAFCAFVALQPAVRDSRQLGR